MESKWLTVACLAHRGVQQSLALVKHIIMYYIMEYNDRFIVVPLLSGSLILKVDPFVRKPPPVYLK